MNSVSRKKKEKIRSLLSKELNEKNFYNISIDNCIFEINRDWEEIFIPLLEESECDYYGNYEGTDENLRNSLNGFENDVFAIYPFNEDKPDENVNFVYKPIRFALRWNSYPLMDAFMNMELNLEEYKEIIDDCMKSLKEK